MLTKIKPWLEPPHFPGDEEKNRVARLMNTLGLYFGGALIASALIFIPFLAVQKTVSWILLAVLIIFFIAARYLISRGRVELSGFVMLTAAWAIFEGVAIFSGSINSPVSGTVIAVVILFGLLIRPRVGLIIMVLTVLINLIAALIQISGHAIPLLLAFPPLAGWFWNAMVLGFVFGLVILVTRDLHNALALARQNEEKLRESEARFSRLANHAPDIIFRYELVPTPKISFINSAVEQITGYSPEDCYADPNLMFSMAHPDDVEIIANYVQTLTPPEEPLYMRWIGKDGVTRWMESRLVRVCDNDGQLMAVEGITRDISRQKEAEQALRESEERFRLLVEQSSDIITILNPDTSSRYESPAHERILGYPGEEIIGGFPLSLVHPDDLPRLREVLEEGLDKPGYASRFEYRIRHKDGSWRCMESLARNLIDNPLINGIIINSRDVTERKHAARRQEIMYQVLRAVSGQLDANGVAQSAVETLVRLTGYPHVCVALPHEEGRHWMVRGAAGSLAAELGAAYSIHSGVIGRAFRNGQMQLVRDVVADPDYVREVSATNTPVLRSEIVATIRHGGDLLGALNIESEREDAFDDEDRALIQSIADVIALALANARLFEDAKREISERKRAEEVLRQSEERFRTLFETMSQGVVYQDADGSIISANPAAEEILGLSLDQMQGRTSMDPRWRAIHEDGSDFPGETHPAMVALRTAQPVQNVTMGVFNPKIEEFTWIEIYASPLFKPGETTPHQVYAMFENITERKRAEEALLYLSTHDGLTGVFTRGFFEAEMARLEHGRDFPVSIIVADLDNMKTTNDTLGHPAGDRLINNTAQVLQETFRAEEIIARTGGDEFAVLLPKTGPAALQQMLTRVRANLDKYNARNPDLPVQLSIGASTAEKDNLVKAYAIADQRMYANKARRKP